MISKSTATSIRLYNGRDKYNEWAFVFTAVSQAPTAPAGSSARPGGPGGAAGVGAGIGTGPGMGPGAAQPPRPAGSGPPLAGAPAQQRQGGLGASPFQGGSSGYPGQTRPPSTGR